MHDTTGLILAGGAGLRAGGRDKGLLQWQGEPLVARVAATLRPQVERLLISCNRNIEQYAAWADMTVVDSRTGFEGPLAGIEASRHYIQSEFLLVAPCDAPLLPRDLGLVLRAQLESKAGEAADIAYAHDGRRDQYLCALLRRSVLDSLPEFLDQGHRAVRHWYAGQRTVAVNFSAQADSFRNINTLD
jgi:molybdopterin-guanine dinucleotide biosynthesis protein A